MCDLEKVEKKCSMENGNLAYVEIHMRLFGAGDRYKHDLTSLYAAPNCQYISIA